MTAQAQDDHLRMLAEDRYRVLMSNVKLSTTEVTSSKLEKTLRNSIRRLAGQMIHGTDLNDAEYNALCRVEERLVARIRDQMIDFAVVVERSRAAEKGQATEYLAPYLLGNGKPEVPA